jgi:hypothetical protein
MRKRYKNKQFSALLNHKIDALEAALVLVFRALFFINPKATGFRGSWLRHSRRNDGA